MTEKRLRVLLSQEQHRPTVACLTTAITFCLWHTLGTPKYFLKHLASGRSPTGDILIDAELFRGFVNVLVIATLVAVIKLVYRQNLSDYGLGKPHWRRVPILVLGTPVMIWFGYLAAISPEYHAFYPATPGIVERGINVFFLHVGILVTYYVAWEMMFRGFLQSSFVARLGPLGAIAAQTLASVLAHTDRPPSELLCSIVAGMIWGFLAYRSKSIWPVVMHHLVLGISLDYFIWFGGVR